MCMNNILITNWHLKWVPPEINPRRLSSHLLKITTPPSLTRIWTETNPIKTQQQKSNSINKIIHGDACSYSKFLFNQQVSFIFAFKQPWFQKWFEALHRHKTLMYWLVYQFVSDILDCFILFYLYKNNFKRLSQNAK